MFAAFFSITITAVYNGTRTDLVTNPVRVPIGKAKLFAGQIRFKKGNDVKQN